MRKSLSLALVSAIVALGTPSAALSAPAGVRARPQSNQQQFATITGTAKGARGEALPNYKVRVRDSSTGAVIAESVTNSAGGFNIVGLGTGNYIVEIVNAAGQVVGLSSVTAVTAGSVATVAVTATAAGSVAAASAGSGFALFGLGTAATVAVIGAASAAGVVGVVAATRSASPSR